VLSKLLLVLVGLAAFPSWAQSQLVNVQIGRRFAAVRRPYVTEHVIYPISGQNAVFPGQPFQASPPWSSPAPWSQPQVPRLVIEIRLIRSDDASGQAFQAPPWSSAPASWPGPSPIGQAFQAPPWSSAPASWPGPSPIGQAFQAPLVCGPGG